MKAMSEYSPISDGPTASADPTANQALGAQSVQPESTPTESRKFSQKIESIAAAPRHRGAFFTEDATSKDLALITAKFKDIKIYWLVDPESDRIYDAKFFSYGGPVSMAIGEVLCERVKGCKLEEAVSLQANELELLLRDTPEIPATAIPLEEAFANLAPLLKTAIEAYPSSKALALASIQLKQSESLQRKTSFENLTERDDNWLKTPKEDQIKQLDAVIERDIRPGLNSDGGDLHIQDLEEGYKLSIKYQGACGSCGSSTGATLAYIEDTLRREIFGGIQVVPVEL